MGLCRGKKTHIASMWVSFTFTQLNAIVGHAGWTIPFIPNWFPIMQPHFHDWHHVEFMTNFGT
jgi:sterol desaturase/sphingolipid hydroxylase (fatty acid hydroxylase superfamily)